VTLPILEPDTVSANFFSSEMALQEAIPLDDLALPLGFNEFSPARLLQPDAAKRKIAHLPHALFLAVAVPADLVHLFRVWLSLVMPAHDGDDFIERELCAQRVDRQSSSPRKEKARASDAPRADPGHFILDGSRIVSPATMNAPFP
jgi:hypothetical protein